MEYRTWIPNCGCEPYGIIFVENTPVCRWSRMPLYETGYIHYTEEEVKRYLK